LSLALLFTALGLILLQYGMVQGLLPLGLSGMFLLFFISLKIKAKDSVKLYSDMDKVESYLKFEEHMAPDLSEGRMAILKEEAYGIDADCSKPTFENCTQAYGTATYSDNTSIIYGDFIGHAKNFRKSIASRFAYERNLAYGIYVNERNSKKISDCTSYIDFSSFLSCFTSRALSRRLKQKGLLNIVMFGRFDYAEFDSLISTFSRKGGLCLLMLESKKLVFYDAKT
jgi:hypothetical protein